MTEKTVGDHYERLKPHQRQFILFCLKTWGETEAERKLNPGLLPFVPARQAIKVLQHRLDTEILPVPGHVPAFETEKNVPNLVAHTRYIRHLISLLADGDARLMDNNVVAAVKDIDASRASTIMTLSSPKVYKLARGRNAPTFFSIDSAFLSAWSIFHGCHTEIEFLQRSSSRWQITCDAVHLNKITTFLADNYR